MKIIVFRPTNVEYTPIDVELVKKPGKGLGLSINGKKSGKGVFIADIVSILVAIRFLLPFFGNYQKLSKK